MRAKKQLITAQQMGWSDAIKNAYPGITTPSRKHYLVERKYFFFKLFREDMKLSHRIIGQMFGRKYSTVIFGLKQANNWMEYDKASREVFQEVKQIYKEIIK